MKAWIVRESRRAARALLHTSDSPERTAAAFAMGVFMGFSPFVGLQTVATLAIAFAFGLNRVAALIGVCLNWPFLMPPYYAAATIMGGWITRQSVGDDLPARLSQLFALSVWKADFWSELVRVMTPLFVPYVSGAMMGAVTLATLAYWTAYTWIRRHRQLGTDLQM